MADSGLLWSAGVVATIHGEGQIGLLVTGAVIRVSEMSVACPGSARPAGLGPVSSTSPRSAGSRSAPQVTPFGLAWTPWLALAAPRTAPALRPSLHLSTALGRGRPRGPRSCGSGRPRRRAGRRRAWRGRVRLYTHRAQKAAICRQVVIIPVIELGVRPPRHAARRGAAERGVFSAAGWSSRRSKASRR